jgi:hypothetical protein
MKPAQEAEGTPAPSTHAGSVSPNSRAATRHSRRAFAVHSGGAVASVRSASRRKAGMARSRSMAFASRVASGAKSRVTRAITEKIASPVHNAGLPR